MNEGAMDAYNWVKNYQRSSENGNKMKAKSFAF
jgi:hypothetical protein